MCVPVKGIANGGRRMAHLLSIAFSIGLLIALGVFLVRMSRRHGWSVRAALVGTWISDRLADTPLARIGNCLRASFPSAEEEPLSDDLNNLVLQLSNDTSAHSAS